MKSGYLSQYFKAVAAKRLSAVEVNIQKSNQHEFNGSKELKEVLQTTERTVFPTTFLWIEEENQSLSHQDTVTWYDARENHETRTEFRLYFHSNAVIDLAREGNIMFIARKSDDSLLIIITQADSTICNQLYWLFGISLNNSRGFEFSAIESNDHVIDFTVRFILDEIGIEIEEPETDLLDSVLSQFPKGFPSAYLFSDFARRTLETEINMIEDPDQALIAYMTWEEKLFRRLERHIISQRIKEGFNEHGDTDVDGFLAFSLSVQNRRKSRAGLSFEDHISYILSSNNIKFSTRVETENKAKPDFLFPDILCYKNPQFPHHLLTMLGAKTSCKERWRQILTEAERIKIKHLLTIEPSITENQTNEMRSHNLQLVIPRSLHNTYTESQQSWLVSLKDFIVSVEKNQSEATVRGFIVSC